MSDQKNNSGDRNSGDRNSGHYNSGHYNSGHYNSGDRNSGHCNSGHRNSGHCNSGHYNSGHCNSGHRNSGHYNSGHYNSGHYNSGFFCTETPTPTFFDLPWSGSWEDASELIPSVDLPVCCKWVNESSMTDQEKVDNPNFATIGGYLKSNPLPLTESFPLAWAKMDEEERAKWTSLPNFDSEKFLKITGVDVRAEKEAAESLAEKRITLEGVEYRLVPV